MAFIIGRIEKIRNIGTLAEADRHNYRTKDYFLCPNVDNERTVLNLHFEYGGWEESAVDTYERQIKKLKRKPRKDHIMALELFFGYSPEAEIDHIEFKDKVLRYMAKKFEGCPFSLDLHMDESTPHIHCLVIPCKKKDEHFKMCGSDWVGKKADLVQFQDEIFREIGEPLGLERGVKGSKDKHKEIQKYYDEITQAQIEYAESIVQENEIKIQKLEAYGQSLDAEINKYKYEDDHNKVLEFQKMIMEYIDMINNEIENANDEADITIFRKCLNLLMTLLRKHKLIRDKEKTHQQER